MTATVTDIQAAIEALFTAEHIPAGYTAVAVLKLGYWEVTTSDPAGVEIASDRVRTDIKGNTLYVASKAYGTPYGTVELEAGK